MKPIQFSDLHIPQPCSMRWEEMARQEEGRFCEGCSKVIHDFSNKDEAKLNQLWQAQKGNICGHFAAPTFEIHPHQLMKPGLAIRLRKAFLTGLALLGLQGVFGKGVSGLEGPGYIQSKNLYQVPDSVIRFTGLVREGGQGSEILPLERAIVFLEVDSQMVVATYTDENGRFVLEIPPEKVAGEGVNLYISHLGRHFVARELEWRSQHVDIILAPISLLDPIEVLGYKRPIAWGGGHTGVPIRSDITCYVTRLPDNMVIPQGYDLNDWLYMNNSEIKKNR